MVDSLSRVARDSVRKGRKPRREQEDEVPATNGSHGSAQSSRSPQSGAPPAELSPPHQATPSGRVVQRSFKQSVTNSSSVRRDGISLLPPVRNDTTRSSYFKMKALGLDPHAGMDKKRPTRLGKRGRSNEDIPLPEKRLFSSSRASPPLYHAADTSLDQIRKPLVHDEEDVELFAAMRAARSAMSESISFFKEELARDELHNSRSSDGLDNSTQTHRSRPRFDHSFNSTTPLESLQETRPPPKYRNRVSKFLPREMYADVLMAKQRETNGEASSASTKDHTEPRKRQGLVPSLSSVRPTSVVRHPERAARAIPGNATNHNHHTTSTSMAMGTEEDEAIDEVAERNQYVQERTMSGGNSAQNSRTVTEDDMADVEEDGSEDEEWDAQEEEGFDDEYVDEYEDGEEEEEDSDEDPYPGPVHGKGGTSMDDAIEL